MFTWNFQYISKTKLEETFEQLKVREEEKDILVRIHTSTHNAAEAVDLAAFIKEILPHAIIFGTSCSAAIYWGKIVKDQCVISLTSADEGRIRKKMVEAVKEDGTQRTPHDIFSDISDIMTDDTKLLLSFSTSLYKFTGDLVEESNDTFPGVVMTGGIADRSPVVRRDGAKCGFVFDENGWSDKAILFASFSGGVLECKSSFVSGAEPGGRDLEITKSYGSVILEINGRNAAEVMLEEAGEEIRDNKDLSELLPFVDKENEAVPVVIEYRSGISISDVYDDTSALMRERFDAGRNIDIEEKTDLVVANHTIKEGTVLRRSFIYDRKIISDNRTLYRMAENFPKDETLFAYSCSSRNRIYPGSVKWELSAYENTNMCGCITDGEISSVGGRNVFLNCSFTMTVLGEREYPQGYNPYAFSQTELVSGENVFITDYVVRNEQRFDDSGEEMPSGLKEFISDCSKKVFAIENDDLPNASAMNMDIDTKGYDRMCIINILEFTEMQVVFSRHMIDMTFQNYISKCRAFAAKKKYRIYSINKWKIAIGQPSFKVSLKTFTDDMHELQSQLFEHSEDHISIVPIFCIINGCTVSNLNMLYYTAKAEMEKKNEQFHVTDAYRVAKSDEEGIRQRYRMVNVINYAIANNKVIPYYQGIHDNKENRIHHYESLMRLRDENGNIYYPSSFLDVARTYGALYDLMQRQMIINVFDRFRDETDISVSINIGMRDIKNRETYEIIFDNLMKANNPWCYVFEILENEDIDDYDDMVAFVDRIHEFGGKISIDDFGSGFSNLKHIASIHSDFLKIDGSIVKECCDDEESEKLIALISYWKKMSIRKVSIVAEFVENEKIQDMMMKYGIDYSQGYLFSKPSEELMRG